jgi:hypothetical protein
MGPPYKAYCGAPNICIQGTNPLPIKRSRSRIGLAMILALKFAPPANVSLSDSGGKNHTWRQIWEDHVCGVGP